MSKTIGSRSVSNAGCGSSTATLCRAAPTGIRTPASRPTARRLGPPVTMTRSVSIVPASVSTAVTSVPPSGRLSDDARDRGPLAQLDARRLHREGVRADVPRRVDGAIGREEAATTMAGGGEGDGALGGLRCVEPLDVKTLRPLHRNALSSGPLVVIRHGEDQVAELTKA